MEKRINKTIENHDKGYNCAQSVACAYCDITDIDEKTMFIMTEAFGLGMGSMLGTCGAVSGACAVISALTSTGNLETPDSKKNTYSIVRKITEEFMDKNSSVICKELKGKDTGVVLRSCPDCIKDAAAILEKVLDDMGIKY